MNDHVAPEVAFDSQVRPKFPEVIDNTMRSAFAACPRKFQYEFLSNLTPVGVNVDLHAGACFAAGLEAARIAHYVNGEPPSTAVAFGMRRLMSAWGDFDPGDHVKNLPRMVGALEYYFSVWPLGMDHLRPHIANGVHRIEFSFAFPIPEVLHPITGQPILYAGRSDMIARHVGGALFVEDDKTTKQLGDSWGRKWQLRSQFTGYAWAAKKSGHPVHGTVIRGVSILKSKYDHAEEIVDQSQWKIDQWYNQLVRDLRHMIGCWHDGYFDMNLGDSCSAYSGCPFVRLCDSPNPQNWIDGNYVARNWDPLQSRDN